VSVEEEKWSGLAVGLVALGVVVPGKHQQPHHVV